MEGRREIKLEALIEDKELNFVFVGGKGGVGKTTTSAAIATQFSYDRKVLLLSTDPAHSLSDAFRTQFKGTPTQVEGIPNLSVLEVNPETSLTAEVERWSQMAIESGYQDLISNVKDFQEWLLGIPGIDEATALANVIGYVESGEYDTIVFDTAPTGHTLKLLQLPKVLQLGIDKLNSWQSKIWGVWSAVKGAASGSNPQNMQKVVAERLNEYKQGVEKIGLMLTDQKRTNFVVVCIAEHLSINESARLLDELLRHQVGVSHVVVNQLVTETVDDNEFADLDAILARANPSEKEKEGLLTRVRASIQLTNARRNIQQKYLKDLRASEGVMRSSIKIVEVPLLPSEVTGAPAILNFSQRLVPLGYRPGDQAPHELKGWVPTPCPVVAPPSPMEEEEEEVSELLQVGDTVTIDGLAKAKQYNGLKGVIGSVQPDGRFGVSVTVNGAKKTLALKSDNLTKVEEEAKEEANDQPASEPAGLAGMGGMSGIEATLMADPEVVEALKNPKFKAAFDDVKANPMNFFQYMSDPEVGPFISKMMGKMGMGGLGGGF